MKPRLLLIGLDGATPQVLWPLLEEGKVPHLGRLAAAGAWGELRSTYPPLTPTAWTSFATGVGPGSHGLMDFIELVPSEYRVRFTNARSRRQATMWRLLNDRGLRVGLYNLPMSFPPEEVEGFLVSGLDTPDETSDFAHPPAIKQEILRRFGSVPLDPRHLGYMRTDALRARVLQEIKEIEVRRAEIFLYLLERHPVDVAMVVFTATDTAQHFFWHYADPKHHRHGPGGHPFAEALTDVYRAVDAAVGRICQALSAPGETPVLVMSDHGHQATSRRRFFPNRLLRRLGLLDLAGEGSACLARLDELMKRLLPPRLKGKLAALFPGLRARWEFQAASLGDFRWDRTRAFCLELLAIPLGYWIHTRERFPQGVVADPLEYEAVVRQILDALRQLRLRGLHRSEVYQGPFVHLAPDILIDWWSDGLVMQRSFPAPADAPVLMDAPADDRTAAWTGTHQMDGVFIFAGEPFQAGRSAARVSLIDLAPLAFHLLGQPAPAHFEGRAPADTLKEGGGIRPAEAAPVDVLTPADEPEETYSDEEADSIAKKLKALGYL
ncbi:MAG: hypothetical protein FJ128_02290 [Deltaproteobacteria bacterium]|nr:hypothetical protein [Deltaproteobacteria bacterium]